MDDSSGKGGDPGVGAVRRRGAERVLAAGYRYALLTAGGSFFFVLGLAQDDGSAIGRVSGGGFMRDAYEIWAEGGAVARGLLGGGQLVIAVLAVIAVCKGAPGKALCMLFIAPAIFWAGPVLAVLLLLLLGRR